MLKIRYNTKTKLLSGWEDDSTKFDALEARKGEETTLLAIQKPDADDYEYYIYDGELMSSSKQPPTPRRDLATEIDKINAKIADYDELKAKVEVLEKK